MGWLRWGLALCVAGISGAWAAPRQPCDSCDTCTAALAAPGANVELSTDLTGAAGAGACVTIAGDGATFNAVGHTITAQGVGVAIEGADVLLRQPTVRGGKTGIHIKGALATVFGARIEGAGTGVQVDGAAGARLDRVTVTGGEVGVAFGPVRRGACAPRATLRSPAAVAQRVSVTGAKVGLAACEARPVLMDVSVTQNSVGLLLGDPKAQGEGPGAAGPYDPCACAPSLDEVRPGTTLFFSSGCGGCKVHEGFLPDVRARGHDVRLRQTGLEHKAETTRYDAFVRRCAPGIIDAIGTPGCVPNYGCLATGDLFKRKGPDGRLVFEHRLNDADGVSGFAAECASAGTTHYGAGDACVQHAVRGLTACGNQKADVIAPAGVTGADNACGAQAIEGLGCTVACEGAPGVPAAAPASAAPAAPASAAPSAAPPAMGRPSAVVGSAPRPATPAPPPSAAPTSAVMSAAKAVNPERSDRPAPPWVMYLGLAVLGLGAVFFWRRDRR